jgi:hypothetical protein
MKMAVIKFPTRHAGVLWVCQCGCFSWILTPDRTICTNCGTVSSDSSGSFKQVLELPENNHGEVMETLDLEDWLKEHANDGDGNGKGEAE